MSFKSPSSGEPAALSYIIPQSQEDLLRRRRALEIVAEDSFGMLGRTPDYVNIQLTSMRQMAGLYGCNNPRYGDNLVQYHEYVRERDLCLTHAFGHPQVNRALAVSELADKLHRHGCGGHHQRGSCCPRGQAVGDAGAVFRRNFLPGVPALEHGIPRMRESTAWGSRFL